MDIRHRVGVRAAPADVSAALTTRAGVAGWWTDRAAGDGGAGGRLVLPFRGAAEPYAMDVLTAEPGAHVRWRVAAGPPEWLGTHVDFRLRPSGPGTVVLFTHQGWAEPVEFLHHCSTKWATFLLSLRELVETGRGRPQPHDLRVDEWG
ncbi:SRPBCC family protein [Cellulomonas pakistanensis]|uniref:SRPBCC family protein n=1 Tax=Cellulomonas pakistanensis TaxID=992287 RepID=UPI001EF3670D|nr:SRPBCC domain-containing protein [Cellulomonas pakistanensis]